MYSTFLPDSAVAHLAPCLEHKEEVSIVCNQFTCIETDPSMEEETEEEEEQVIEAFKKEVMPLKQKALLIPRSWPTQPNMPLLTMVRSVMLLVALVT